MGAATARFLPTGHIVYALGGTLLAVPFDLRLLEARGGPVPIVQGVRRGNTPEINPGVAHFSVSRTGALIYVPGPVSPTPDDQELVRLDLKGGTGAAEASARPLRNPSGLSRRQATRLRHRRGQGSDRLDLRSVRCELDAPADGRGEETATRSGLPTENGSHFSRIAKVTSAFSGSAPMAQALPNA